LNSDEEHVTNVDMYSAGKTLLEFADTLQWDGMRVINVYYTIPFTMNDSVISYRSEQNGSRVDDPNE